MSEGFVGLGHTVNIVFLLDRSATEIRRIKQLVSEPLGHSLVRAIPCAD